MPDPLPSWNESTAKVRILEFLGRVTAQDGPDFVPPSERIAVFDNDGTLWCEKPMPVELGFILERLDDVAGENRSLCDRQPWKAAHSRPIAL